MLPLRVRYAVLAHGDDPVVYRQARMLLVSLLAYAPRPHELVVVTDHGREFDWFNGAVDVAAVTGEQIIAWRGPDPFSMRQKLEAATHVAPPSDVAPPSYVAQPFRAASSPDALVFLDADTIATRDLSPMVDLLARGALLMHTREFELGRSRRRGNIALWQQLRDRSFGGSEFRETDAMWNSGVLALPSKDVPLLGTALALYDALGAAGIRHFATEQLALGLVLQRTGRLKEAAPWIRHYWGNKKRYDEEIRRRFDAGEAALEGCATTPACATPEEAADELKRNPIDLPAAARPGKLEKLRRWLFRS